MNKIEILHRYSGEVLYTYECKDNTIKKTVEDANLTGADLRDAYLRGANLTGANLTGADLRGANITMYCKWSVYEKNGNIQIGCESKSIEEWDLWFDGSDEFDTKRGTEDFKRIEAVYLGYKSYLEHLKK